MNSFKPVKVREALDRRDGNTGESEHSYTSCSRNSPAIRAMLSAEMMRPGEGGDAVIGPFIEKTSLEPVVAEMGRLAIQVGQHLLSFYPAAWDRADPGSGGVRLGQRSVDRDLLRRVGAPAGRGCGSRRRLRLVFEKDLVGLSVSRDCYLAIDMLTAEGGVHDVGPRHPEFTTRWVSVRWPSITAGLLLGLPNSVRADALSRTPQAEVPVGENRDRGRKNGGPRRDDIQEVVVGRSIRSRSHDRIQSTTPANSCGNVEHTVPENSHQTPDQFR